MTTTLSNKISMPNILLRLEGLVVLAVALTLYATWGYNWSTFAWLILVPDISFVPYLIDKRLGSITYNLFHTYTFPLTLALISLLMDMPLGLQIALIWFAHIGVDRLIGYGLKYPDSFHHTHLGRV